MTQLQFETPRLRMEDLGAEHAAALFPALADPRVNEHIGNVPPASVEQLGEDFARRSSGPPPHRSRERWLEFAVQLKTDGTWIGRLEATIYVDYAEVAYVFGAAHWGQGLASEGLAWLHEYVRSSCGVSKYWATTAPANERSIRLLLRSGYERVSLHEDRPLGSYDPGDEVFTKS